MKYLRTVWQLGYGREGIILQSDADKIEPQVLEQF